MGFYFGNFKFSGLIFSERISFFFISFFLYSDFLNNVLDFSFQSSVTPIMEGIIDLHNHIFFFLILVFVFVFWIFGNILYTFWWKLTFPRNEVDIQERVSLVFLKHLNHNNLLEIIWTLIPSFILIIIAIPSFILLYTMDEINQPSLTIKIIGHQWYWSYQYSNCISQLKYNCLTNLDLVPESLWNRVWHNASYFLNNIILDDSSIVNDSIKTNSMKFKSIYPEYEKNKNFVFEDKDSLLFYKSLADKFKEYHFVKYNNTPLDNYISSFLRDKNSYKIPLGNNIGYLSNNTLMKENANEYFYNAKLYKLFCSLLKEQDLNKLYIKRIERLDFETWEDCFKNIKLKKFFISENLYNRLFELSVKNNYFKYFNNLNGELKNLNINKLFTGNPYDFPFRFYEDKNEKNFLITPYDKNLYNEFYISPEQFFITSSVRQVQKGILYPLNSTDFGWFFDYLIYHIVIGKIVEGLSIPIDLTTLGKDLPGVEFDSYLVNDNDLITIGEPRLLQVDEPLVLPVNTDIRLLITGDDVIHSFAVPALGIKVDAVPGRLNQQAIYLKREGIFYGQCSEICGVNHGFMPIVVKSVSMKDFIYWYLSKFDKLYPEYKFKLASQFEVEKFFYFGEIPDNFKKQFDFKEQEAFKNFYTSETFNVENKFSKLVKYSINEDIIANMDASLKKNFKDLKDISTFQGVDQFFKKEVIMKKLIHDSSFNDTYNFKSEVFNNNLGLILDRIKKQSGNILDFNWGLVIFDDFNKDLSMEEQLVFPEKYKNLMFTPLDNYLNRISYSIKNVQLNWEDVMLYSKISLKNPNFLKNENIISLWTYNHILYTNMYPYPFIQRFINVDDLCETSNICGIKSLSIKE